VYSVCKCCTQKDTISVCPVCHSKKNSVSLYYTNKDKGCDWQGEVNEMCHKKCLVSILHDNIDEYKKSCPLEEVTSTNSCRTILQQRYLTTHIKTGCPYHKVDCKYCHVIGQYQYIEGEHDKQCLKLPILSSVKLIKSQEMT